MHRMKTVGVSYIWPNITISSDGVNALPNSISESNFLDPGVDLMDSGKNIR